MILQIFILLFIFISAYIFYIARLETIEKRRTELRENIHIKNRELKSEPQNEKGLEVIDLWTK